MKAFRRIIGIVLAALMLVGVIYTPRLGTKYVSAAETKTLYIEPHIDYVNKTIVSGGPDNKMSYTELTGYYGLGTDPQWVLVCVGGMGSVHYLNEEDISSMTLSEGISVEPYPEKVSYGGQDITVFRFKFTNGPGEYTITYEDSTVKYTLNDPRFGFFEQNSMNWTNMVSNLYPCYLSYVGWTDIYALGSGDITFSADLRYYDDNGNLKTHTNAVSASGCELFTFTDASDDDVHGLRMTRTENWPAEYADCCLAMMDFYCNGEGYSLAIANEPMIKLYNGSRKVISTSETTNKDDLYILFGSDVLSVEIDEYNSNYRSAEISDIKIQYYAAGCVEMDIDDFFDISPIYEEADNTNSRWLGAAFHCKQWPEEYMDIRYAQITVETEYAAGASLSYWVKNPNYPTIGAYEGYKYLSNRYEDDGTDLCNVTYYPAHRFAVYTDDALDVGYEIVSITAKYCDLAAGQYSNDTPIELKKVVDVQLTKDADCGDELQIQLNEWPEELANVDNYDLHIVYKAEVEGAEEKDYFVRVNKPLYGAQASLDDAIEMQFLWCLDSQMLSKEDTYVKVEVGDTVQYYYAKDLPKFDSYTPQECRVLNLRLNSSQMNDAINLTLYYKGYESGSYKNITFADYAKNLRNKYNGTYLADLIDATLNYGDYSRKYFGHNLEGSFNNVYAPIEGANVTDVMAQYTAEAVKADIKNKYANNEGFITNKIVSANTDIWGISLTCRDRVSFNLYLETKGNLDAEDVYVVAGPANAKVTPTKSNVCKVTLANIPVWSLGTVQTITLNTGNNDSPTVSEDYVVNPMEYIYLAMDSNNEALVNLSRAMYIYYVAGTEYMIHNIQDEYESEIIGK